MRYVRFWNCYPVFYSKKVQKNEITQYNTAWKVSKYGVISGLYFPAFGLNAERYFAPLRVQPECGKYGPEITRYLDTFHVV